ncbi:hypothetical protein [Lentzea sp. NPDC092896]|uniref:hypothetical protein n=1 Tax=Lentzea sp. NPDC092896 TaxID=3364127 RepID=UPI00382037D6
MNNTVAHPIINVLSPIFGEEFLRYILAAEDFTEIGNLNDGQMQVAQTLLGLVNSAQTVNDSSLTQFNRFSGFSSIMPETGNSIVNYFRIQAGGEVAEISKCDDPLLASLLKITSDVWPIYLLPTPAEGPRTFWAASPIGIYQHPLLNEAASALISDDALSKVFPVKPKSTTETNNLDDTIEYHSILHSATTGRGGGIQLVGLISSLVSDAIFRSLIGRDRLTWEAIEQGLESTLDEARKLANGKAVLAPTLSGLTGIQLDPDVIVKTSSGTLRSPTKPEIDLLLPKAEQITAVFETSYRMKLYIHPEISLENILLQKTGERLQPQMDEARLSFQRSLDMLRLALLLESNNNDLHVAREVSRFTLDPFQHGGAVHYGFDQYSLPSHALTKTTATAVQEWHELIRSKHYPTLDVGVRRLLSAVTSRLDPLDSFVDAVICWENMFGAKTETTFRVTASVAKLIGPDNPAGRYDFQSELKELYSKRSALVHGGKEPPANKIWGYRERAIEIAADCFRALYRDRPELLELESEKRSAILLLE